MLSEINRLRWNEIESKNKPSQTQTFIIYDILKRKKLVGTKISFYTCIAVCH